MKGVRIGARSQRFWPTVLKFLLTFSYNRFIKCQTQLTKEDSFEPTKKNNANEVSGECLVRVSFERLYHLCAD